MPEPLYDEVRPSYPDALAVDLLARGRRVLELGAGTGKATVVLARAGASIVALEPGPAMAAILRRNVAGRDVTVVESTFEAWPITEPFDIVCAAQSIHWIAPQARYVKTAAALAPGGTLAVLRNEQDAIDPELRAELDAAYARFKPGGEGPLDPASARRKLAAEIDASGLFGPVDVAEYRWSESYRTARYLGLLDTYSDHALLPPEQRAPLYEAIASAIDRRGGVIAIPYVSMAFAARRV